jgi:RHH-type rel operon transcriptional repressor/antitoxin RelB
MAETFTIRIDCETKKRLDSLSKLTGRSKSSLAAEAIAAFVEREEWQFEEIRAGIDELDSGKSVPHVKVSNWLNSWGKHGSDY